MQESEVKIIPQKQSFWWKIGGWLPVVIMSGIFFSLAYVIQSIPPPPPPASAGTEIVSEGVAWTSWVPLVLFMVFVFVAIVVAWTKKEALQKWLEEKKKTEDEAKWFWYIIVAIITISASYVAPDRYNIVVAFVVALFGLHVVWLFLITAKTSTTTKALVTGFFSFIIVAGLLPGTSTYFNAKWRVIKKDVAVKSAAEKKYADDYENGVTPSNESSHSSAPADNNTGSYVASQTLQVVPGERFRKVSIPPGRILKDLTWDCPNGCILEIVHDGQPMCPTTNIYQGLPCGMLPVEVGRSGVPRYREQFVTPYGHFINFPRDIVVVGVAFGTDAVLGPIEVTATITL